MRHEEILKRARLLAQAANDAAEAALTQKYSKIDGLNHEIPHSSLKTEELREDTCPSLLKRSSPDQNNIDSLRQNENFLQDNSLIVRDINESSLPAISGNIKNTIASVVENPGCALSLPSISIPKDEHREISPRGSETLLHGETNSGRAENIGKTIHDEDVRNPSIHVKCEINDPILPYIQEYYQSRSTFVNRRSGPNQVLCYLCCNEFGTASLLIHQKTCWSKHEWALERILNDETVSIKEAKKNWKKCEIPSHGSSLPPLPSSSSDAQCFVEYNQEAIRLFFTHVLRCLWCRMNNSIAKLISERVKATEETNRLKKIIDEEERRKAEEDEEARRRRQMEEEEEERRRREEDERRRMQLEDEASEAERRRLLALGKHTFLRKGRGTQAANQTAKLLEEKEKNERAKQEILNYSLQQAKKKGYVSKSEEKETTNSVKYIEMTDEAMKNFMEEHNQKYSSWDSKWSLEEEELFSNSDVVLKSQCI